MKTRTNTGLAIIEVALILGVLGDVLLRGTPWGLNVLLFNLAFAGGTVVLLRQYAPGRLTGQTYALLGALIFFASMFVWRDSMEMRFADTVAIVAILGALFLPAMKISANVAGAFQYAASVLWAGVNALFAPFALLASDVRWTELPMSGWRKHAFALFRSLLIVTPLILIFGALFMAADAVYDGWIRKILNVDFEMLFSHGLLFTLFAWLTAGYFRGAIFSGAAAVEAPHSIIAGHERKPDQSPVASMRAESGELPIVLPDNKTVIEHINFADMSEGNVSEHAGSDSADASDAPAVKTASTQRPWSWANLDNSIVPGFTLGTVEIFVILGLVNLLFLSFVIVQVPYLFGGMHFVQNTPDFKLADYARRGFGELVTVSALVLPILLTSHWLIKKESPFTEKLFRILAGIQIALLFVIMASAAQRLVLLTGNLGYGLTIIRLYPMIFMAWLAVVFVWFGLTVLRSRRNHFAWGALWAAFVILGATHVLNPDAFIVSTNIRLMQQGREFDRNYNFTLSADAVPEALKALPQLSLDDQCSAKVMLHSLYRELGLARDLRSLNWSRKVAWQALDQNDAVINQIDGCPNWVHENIKRDGEFDR
jgi:Domain of unknown function (DUF4173)